jgi:rod shape determining protein RodA
MSIRWRALDLPLLICLALLAALGSATLYAAVHQGDVALWQRQNLHWLLGLGAFILMCFLPLRISALAAWPLYVIALLFLALVPMVGEVQLGARRWLDLGLFHLQPSEMMKWALMLLMAHWFASREANRPAPLFIGLAFAVVPAGLIFLQPDLGTTLVLLFATTAMLLASGLPWRWFAYAVTAGLLSAPLLWHNMHDYQRKRILSFLDPQSDPLGAGYHVIQSTIAIGSGGIFGKGYLQGTQARLHFLPEQHTDFIFGVMAEEGGLIVAMLLLTLYAIMIYRILGIAARAHTRFASLICLGIASIFLIYISVNIGMVSGLLPVVGVPLPFISYGGSALVTMMAAMGMVMRVAIESENKVAWQRPGSPLL